MIATTKIELKTPADKRFGYVFACEGTVSLKAAQEALGGLSRTSMERRFESGRLRKGMDCGRVVVCKRSLREYLSSIES